MLYNDSYNYYMYFVVDVILDNTWEYVINTYCLVIVTVKLVTYKTFQMDYSK